MIRWRRVTHDDFYPSFAEPADGDTSRFVVSLWDNLVPRHGIVIAVAVRYARRFSVLRSGGLNPFIAREQLESRLNQSQMMSPPAQPAAEKSIEQRLAELEDLHDRGVISDAELAAGRAKTIAGS